YVRLSLSPHRPRSPLFPYTTLFRSDRPADGHRRVAVLGVEQRELRARLDGRLDERGEDAAEQRQELPAADGELDEEGEQEQAGRSEEHTSELQSRFDLVCRLPLEKK